MLPVSSAIEQSGIDHERLYDFRFRRVGAQARRVVWAEIARYLYRRLGAPTRVLDAAAGHGEFIHAVPAAERWAVDLVAFPELLTDPGVVFVQGDLLDIELPDAAFDAVLVSNALEHFPSQDAVGTVLRRLRATLAPGGRIAVLGPNFRYCPRHYFDCADHTVALTHVSVSEHLYAAGFEIEAVVPRFLPYSFRGRLPTGRRMVRAYLGFPPAWRVLGKQLLVIGRAPGDP